MASLKDVKVIDMKDGNPTKIEYNGKEYKKVTEGGPNKGDIGSRIKVEIIAHVDETHIGETYGVDMDTFDKADEATIAKYTKEDAQFRKVTDRIAKVGD